ncbi:MAG TPA: GIY-YIG nuclease family protein [Vicinamibacteria bacterium]|nr:GIY-YIG nuclease family protein [Vicinamibacteria bacterium]
MSFVYILRCGDGSLYTGIAKDLAARLRKHRAGRASRYTRAHLPVTLVWSREVSGWSRALREERRIKKLCRSDKEALLAGGLTGLPGLPGTRRERRQGGLYFRLSWEVPWLFF